MEKWGFLLLGWCLRSEFMKNDKIKISYLSSNLNAACSNHLEAWKATSAKNMPAWLLEKMFYMLLEHSNQCIQDFGFSHNTDIASNEHCDNSFVEDRPCECTIIQNKWKLLKILSQRPTILIILRSLESTAIALAWVTFVSKKNWRDNYCVGENAEFLLANKENRKLANRALSLKG